MNPHFDDGVLVILEFGEFADTLSTISDREAVWAHVAGFARDRGFSKCSLTMAALSNDKVQSLLLLSDLPEEFCSLYQDNNLADKDPFILFCCHTLECSKVTTKNFSEFSGASPEHQAFLDFTAESGAKNGLGIPVRTFGPNPFGGWLFTSHEENHLFDIIHDEYATELHLAGVLAHEKLAHIGDLSSKNRRLLSDRETECLRWLSAGLRTASVAEKMSISQSAVNLYVTNAKRKLRAKTREQAIARAIIRGDIVL